MNNWNEFKNRVTELQATINGEEKLNAYSYTIKLKDLIEYQHDKRRDDWLTHEHFSKVAIKNYIVDTFRLMPEFKDFSFKLDVVNFNYNPKEETISVLYNAKQVYDSTTPEYSNELFNFLKQNG